MTSLLLLLRHSKAAWAEPGMRDYDRPLTPAGRQHAHIIGQRIAAGGWLPAKVLCSSAVRTRQTLDGCMASLGAVPDGIDHVDSLFSADAGGYLDLIRATRTDGPLLVIGHNPMMEDLAMGLTGDGDADARARIANGFPTSGLAVISFPERFAAIQLGQGSMIAFEKARD